MRWQEKCSLFVVMVIYIAFMRWSSDSQLARRRGTTPYTIGHILGHAGVVSPDLVAGAPNAVSSLKLY
jgi:hypothetical protein